MTDRIRIEQRTVIGNRCITMEDLDQARVIISEASEALSRAVETYTKQLMTPPRCYHRCAACDRPDVDAETHVGIDRGDDVIEILCLPCVDWAVDAGAFDDAAKLHPDNLLRTYARARPVLRAQMYSPSHVGRARLRELGFHRLVDEGDDR